MVRTGRGKIFCFVVRLFFDKFFGVVGSFMKKGGKSAYKYHELWSTIRNEEI